jgi:putative heme utilization carrier protein HutX
MEEYEMKMPIWLVALAVLVPTVGSTAEPRAELCATAPQAEAIGRAWSAKTPRLATVARESGVSEAVALSALPRDRAVGVSGSAFGEVWASLQAWPDAVTVIMKADQVFEVHGRVPPGEPSKISKYFNLDPKAEGITGHLRPDRYAAIAAATLPGRDRSEHGVLFFDSAGSLIFGVYVPNEHSAADSAVVTAFEATKRLIGSLPPLCRRD